MNVMVHLDQQMIDRIFDPRDIVRLRESHTLMFRDSLERINEADVLITGWGTPRLDDAFLDRATRLRLIAHAAGSTRYLLPGNFWSRNVRLCSANEALGEGVAETTFAMIVAGLKAFFPCAELTRDNRWKHEGLPWPVRELYGVTIGVIGASKIGRSLMRILRSFQVQILLYDPFVNDDEARELGAERVELDDLMRESDVVTLHAPALESTRHMLSSAQFRAMKNFSIFINTARGMIVDEAALVDELKTGRIFAFLDVTDPEPPRPDHPFRKLPNCVLTPHIAGAISNGCRRQGRSITEQICEFAVGKLMHGEVTAEIAAIMA